jgi:hypothetical protein
LRKRKSICIFALAIKQGLVVQLVRIHACHAWGRGFESRPDRKYCLKPFLMEGLFLCNKSTFEIERFFQNPSYLSIKDFSIAISAKTVMRFC